MNVAELKAEFIALCRPLADRPEFVHTCFEEGKKSCSFSMLLRACKIELVYCWKWETLAPPSVLFCRVYLNKNVPLFLHLPELLCELEAEDFRACYFPCIESARRMADCFHALMAVVDDYIPRAEALAQSARANAVMQRRFREEFLENRTEDKEKNVWNYNDSTDRTAREFIDTAFESVLVERFTANAAYLDYLTGNWERSLKRYQKMEKSGLSVYETKLCRFMARPENRGFQAMPPQCMAMTAYQKFEQGPRCLGDMLLCSIPWSALFFLIIAGMNVIMARGTVFFFGVPLWCCLIPGLGCGVFGYIAFQKQYLKWMNRRQELEFAQLSDHHGRLKKLTVAIFGLVAALGLAFCISLPLMSSRFYDHYAVILHDEFRRFEYADLDSVYMIRGRYNEYGDFIARPSYVLVFRDGMVDLDCEASLKKQKMLVETLFPDRVAIEAESDRELPKT